ncbi:HAD-IIIA family hydrolase [Bacillus sp. DJP31]|uniref:HAD-IIIA family hydrolase n=1 Tax=Bacillus sp. DJP31 TaxID=3409789 RepID=UPI003BB62D9B
MIAVFLDRDGTIGGTGGGIHPFEFTMYDFAPSSIRRLNGLGVKVFLFTNQTRVGRGYFTEEELLEGFKIMQDELERNGAYLDGIYYCPHSPDDGCTCQKPKNGLLIAAKEEHELQLESCYVVGDTGSSDMIAAHSVGARKVLVKTGWGESSLSKHRDKWVGIDPEYIANNLVDAVRWIDVDVKKKGLVPFLLSPEIRLNI